MTDVSSSFISQINLLTTSFLEILKQIERSFTYNSWWGPALQVQWRLFNLLLVIGRTGLGVCFLVITCDWSLNKVCCPSIMNKALFWWGQDGGAASTVLSLIRIITKLVFINHRPYLQANLIRLLQINWFIQTLLSSYPRQQELQTGVQQYSSAVYSRQAISNIEMMFTDLMLPSDFVMRAPPSHLS